MKQICRIQDTASACGDFFVAQSGYLVTEFSVTTTGLDDVGVGVAECGEDEAAFGVDKILTSPYGLLRMTICAGLLRMTVSMLLRMTSCLFSIMIFGILFWTIVGRFVSRYVRTVLHRSEV